MAQRISMKVRHLTGKSAMKKAMTAMVMGVALLTLSSCGEGNSLEDAQTNEADSAAEAGGSTAATGGSADEVQETSDDNTADSTGSDLAELEKLTGEYEYVSDIGTGKLIIRKTSNGYDICDYESESFYRFLAGSFDIETIENNKIYLKCPEQVFSDDTVIFSYYVLVYSEDEIDVYYGESGFEETQFLYHATKKKDEGSAGRVEGNLYEGEYSSYDVNEPSLEIKINDDGTCQIQIDLFRLWSFYDGVGKITAEGLEFAATGPGGKKVNGVIKLEEDIATVTIFGQEWLDFAGLSEYKFYKTSDVPNIDEDFPDIDDFSADQQDGSAKTDELLDSFINGRINAVDSADSTSTFSIADLNVDADRWETYSAGEKADLDNDGENELIVNGPYGGIYLDARDNGVYEFAAGEGNALTLSYTVYNGAVWIMYSNRMNAGYECYHMEKYEGADNLVGEMNFSEEPVDANNPEFGMKYMLNGTEISHNEYTDLCSKIFAAEVNTGGRP